MKNISEVLTGVKTMGIAGHIRPDGDCVGSCMALYLYVTEHFPEIDIWIIPSLSFLILTESAISVQRQTETESLISL